MLGNEGEAVVYFRWRSVGVMESGEDVNEYVYGSLWLDQIYLVCNRSNKSKCLS